MLHDDCKLISSEAENVRGYSILFVIPYFGRALQSCRPVFLLMRPSSLLVCISTLPLSSLRDSDVLCLLTAGQSLYQ